MWLLCRGFRNGGLWTKKSKIGYPITAVGFGGSRPTVRRYDRTKKRLIADIDGRRHRKAMETRVAIFESPDGDQRVIIFRRVDGNFTFRKQWADPSVLTGPDFGWGTLGPDCGIYGSCDTAETEAMQRIAWLRAGFH